MSGHGYIPTDKSDAINQVCENMTGKSRVHTILTGKCMTCDGEADGFRNELSVKEYTISGMCQKCQDKTFGVW